MTIKRLGTVPIGPCSVPSAMANNPFQRHHRRSRVLWPAIINYQQREDGSRFGGHRGSHHRNRDHDRIIQTRSAQAQRQIKDRRVLSRVLEIANPVIHDSPYVGLVLTRGDLRRLACIPSSFVAEIFPQYRPFEGLARVSFLIESAMDTLTEISPKDVDQKLQVLVILSKLAHDSQRLALEERGADDTIDRGVDSNNENVHDGLVRVQQGANAYEDTSIEDDNDNPRPALDALNMSALGCILELLGPVEAANVAVISKQFYYQVCGLLPLLIQDPSSSSSPVSSTSLSSYESSSSGSTYALTGVDMRLMEHGELLMLRNDMLEFQTVAYVKDFVRFIISAINSELLLRRIRDMGRAMLVDATNSIVEEILSIRHVRTSCVGNRHQDEYGMLFVPPGLTNEVDALIEDIPEECIAPEYR